MNLEADAVGAPRTQGRGDQTAVALKDYAKQQDELRAAVAIGKFSRGLPKAKFIPKKGAHVASGGKNKEERLKAEGISIHTAYRCEKLVASNPELDRDFDHTMEQYLARRRREGKRPTSAGLMEANRRARRRVIVGGGAQVSAKKKAGRPRPSSKQQRFADKLEATMAGHWLCFDGTDFWHVPARYSKGLARKIAELGHKLLTLQEQRFAAALAAIADQFLETNNREAKHRPTFDELLSLTYSGMTTRRLFEVGIIDFIPDDCPEMAQAVELLHRRLSQAKALMAGNATPAQEALAKAVMDAASAPEPPPQHRERTSAILNPARSIKRPGILPREA